MLDENKLLCIKLMLKGESKTDIAKILKISRRTIYKWMEDEEFKEELSECREESKNRAREIINNEAVKAAKVIVDLMTKAKSEKVRCGAALDILDRGLGKATNKVEINSDNNVVVSLVEE